jgi:3-methyladenine DNA glycosylase AlkD
MVSNATLSEIHAQFRRQMNADVAAALARGGVKYHLCFGVPSMRLREVAERYAPSAELAETLWHEDIRESKMLATRLYPALEMERTTAERWVGEVPYTEIADQVCMNLFSRLPYAPALTTDWLQADPHTEPMKCYCALMLQARCASVPMTPALSLRLEQWAADVTLSIALRTAALQLTDHGDER